MSTLRNSHDSSEQQVFYEGRTTCSYESATGGGGIVRRSLDSLPGVAGVLTDFDDASQANALGTFESIRVEMTVGSPG